MAAPALCGVATIVRSTHERVDGGGYPDGLEGDQIPLGARIIAVCDAFDAMTTDRVYRRAMPREAAIAELEASSGTQFDPFVVAAARAVLEHPGAERPAGERRPSPRTPDLSAVARIQGLVDVIRLVRVEDDPDRLLDEIAVTVGRALGLGTRRHQHVPARVGRLHRLERPRQRGGARTTLLGSEYSSAWFEPVLAPQYLRRGAYVIEQGTFDWGSHLADRYVPSDAAERDPERLAARG